MPRRISTRLARSAFPGAFAATAALALAPPEASAHFILEAPPSWMSQDGLGSPQKSPPCGDNNASEGAGTATGIVTPFVAGDTLTLTIDETLYHPGHYRVALALNDRSELPDPPPVTAGPTDCGSTIIQTPPAFPVLADGALLHDAPFDAPQTIQVTLPAGVTCEKCTLQVIQFMSDHGLNDPGGCFYHHCADISIRSATAGAAGAPPGGAGGQGGANAGGSNAGGPNAGGPNAGGPNAGGPNAGGPNAGGQGGVNVGSANGGGQGGAPGNPASGDDESSDDGCAAASPGAANPGLAGLAGLFATAALLRRRRR